jgi:hypothetical protein
VTDKYLHTILTLVFEVVSYVLYKRDKKRLQLAASMATTQTLDNLHHQSETFSHRGGEATITTTFDSEMRFSYSPFNLKGLGTARSLLPQTSAPGGLKNVKHMNATPKPKAGGSNGFCLYKSSVSPLNRGVSGCLFKNKFTTLMAAEQQS